MENLQSSSRRLFGGVKLYTPGSQIALAALLIIALLGVGTEVTLAAPILRFYTLPLSINEGNSGEQLLEYTIEISQVLIGAESITVRMTTPGTATNPATMGPGGVGDDYNATQLYDLTFDSSTPKIQPYPVTIYSDTTNELNEMFEVVGEVVASNVASVPVGMKIATTSLITDDDNPSVLSITSPSVVEGPGAALTFLIMLSEPPIAGDDASIAYRNVSGSAVDGSDFTGTGAGVRYLTIPAGSSSGTIVIPVIDDHVNEPPPDETFSLSLLPASSLNLNWGGAPAPPSSATGTIIDGNDPPSDISLTSTSIDENQAIGSAVGTFGAIDADSTTFTYALVTGIGAADNASFSITSAAGVSTLRSAAVFDFETKSSYNIRVRVTDNGSPGLTFEKALTITLNNLTETPALIVLSSGATPYVLRDPAVVVDAAATAIDEDSPDFNNAQVRVALANGAIGDLLSVRDEGVGAGTISVSAMTISYNGTPIGTLSGGAYPTPLTINLAASGVSKEAMQALLRNITFSNSEASTAASSRAATFTLKDKDGLISDGQSKQISIDQPPVAIDDTANISVNSGAQIISVLANDSDPDSDSLTISAVTQGSHGAVAIRTGAASVAYTPSTDYSGPDSFTYTISDGRGGFASATVQMTVGKTFVFMPLVHLPAFADLTASIQVAPAIPQAGQPATINVSVTNIGAADAANFWVDFYINPSRGPEVNDPWNELCAIDPCFGMAWYYTGTLAPGQSVVLNSNPQSVANPNGFNSNVSDWRGYFANGTTRLYALADSWNRNASGTIRNPNGAIDERDEANNRAEQAITVTYGVLTVRQRLQNADRSLTRN